MLYMQLRRILNFFVQRPVFRVIRPVDEVELTFLPFMVPLKYKGTTFVAIKIFQEFLSGFQAQEGLNIDWLSTLFEVLSQVDEPSLPEAVVKNCVLILTPTSCNDSKISKFKIELEFNQIQDSNLYYDFS